MRPAGAGATPNHNLSSMLLFIAAWCVCELSFGGNINQVRKGYDINCLHHVLEVLNDPVLPPSTPFSEGVVMVCCLANRPLSLRPPGCFDRSTACATRARSPTRATTGCLPRRCFASPPPRAAA